jgi:hypothetical protein
MSVAAGMSLDSGLPATAVQLVENIDLAQCGMWCGWDFHRAPFAMTGQFFSYAEVEARVGNKERASQFLEMPRATPRYADWPFKADADAAAADLDAFVGKFAARGPSESVSDLMQDTHVRCDLPRGHRGNHHAKVTGTDLHLARDGHTIRATAWQVEWREDAARSAA